MDTHARNSERDGGGGANPPLDMHAGASQCDRQTTKVGRPTIVWPPHLINGLIWLPVTPCDTSGSYVDRAHIMARVSDEI